MTNTPRQRGFTLVEVLVALLIMAILAAMGWQGVDGMVRARDISQQTAERTLRLTTVVGQWEQDLASLYESATVPGLQFTGATLRLTRLTPEGAQVVVWSLREGVWQRWASPSVRRAFELQQAWMMSQQLIGNEDRQVRLLEGASEWQVYFYRGNAWTNAQSTGDVVVAPQSAALAASGILVPRATLPSGVRLVINWGDQRLMRDVMLGPTQP